MRGGGVAGIVDSVDETRPSTAMSGLESCNDCALNARKSSAASRQCAKRAGRLVLDETTKLSPGGRAHGDSRSGSVMANCRRVIGINTMRSLKARAGLNEQMSGV